MIWVQVISSRTEEVVIFIREVFSAASSLSLFIKCWKKLNLVRLQTFFINATCYAFELFILVLFLTLDFENIQNKLKWINTIKSNLVPAKICCHKKTLICLMLSWVPKTFDSLGSFLVLFFWTLFPNLWPLHYRIQRNEKKKKKKMHLENEQIREIMT